MCGLAGIVDLGGPVEDDRIAAMGRALAHRGPDDEGFFGGPGVALVFRRLSIIDLSEAGHQPMSDAEGRYVLLHNGEVYNYRELRRELEGLGHSFRSATDTEVILEAYREWGEACVERFRGMWAFVVWDTRERRLFCSRDRFGIKPFFYRLDGQELVFASELKAFRAAGVQLAANPSAVRDFLALGLLDHREETFFAGIRQLLPAHNLVFDGGGMRISRYWQLERREPPADPAAAVREAFLESVDLHLRSDVPVGTALSGGLDSSAIVGAVAEHGQRGQPTFTVYFEDAKTDERPFAEAVVERAGASPHWVTFSEDDLARDLPAIVETLEEPFAGTSNAAHWYVMRAAHEAGMKVMLDGQGGDEVFAGYPTYFRSRFADLLAAGRVAELAAEAKAYRSVHRGSLAHVASTVASPFFPRGLTSRARARLTGASSLLHDDLGPAPAAPGTNGSVFPDRLRRRLEQMLVAEHLPQMLRYEDRNSMAHSIEARVPFLDHKLVELVFSLDGGELIRRGRTKDVLRRAVADLLPPVVRDRTDKLGFPTPQGRWFRGRIGELSGEVFGSPEFRQRGFVDPAAARSRLAAVRDGRPSQAPELWRALSLELWARAFLAA